MTGDPYGLRPLGRVESPLTQRTSAPKQPDEGAPPAVLAFDPQYAVALSDLRPGTDVLLLTWFDRSDRDVLAVHPRGDHARPETGVFSTRSPDRPNPIGLHEVTVTAVEPSPDGRTRVHVAALEALDGTPILDVKPLLACRPSDR
ncbi:tRNA (N6-threonylcarbamoyladenosine(37)-N6)-methyltransferase TrmO [Streptomyces sp. RKND-216]|uniref:tRNA (N6-threonylcarbamoyladenosine(37)-N6)-methyltransferase TrmO n=1 Tax=Streptomyces sp. RKND-216 TaxID=2562581 RepID=UPI001B34D066|nr:tRNA (N6-threonylcarbamoyladenosine(37)-N6)-methyltransferase TrmO [Streptomyces sp. RKND-216]